MAKKTSTLKPVVSLAKILSDKLKKVGAKGALRSKLLGKPGIAEALDEMERDRLIIKLRVPGDFHYFATEFKPATIEDYIRSKCEAYGSKIWSEKDPLNKLPAYYDSQDAARALKALCNSSDVIRLQAGKAAKYLYHRCNGSSPSNGYFVSETARFIYALVELDGENQQRALGLTPAHYRNRDTAQTWYRGVAMMVHPDHCHHPKAKEAMGELDRIYRRMVGDT